MADYGKYTDTNPKGLALLKDDERILLLMVDKSNMHRLKVTSLYSLFYLLSLLAMVLPQVTIYHGSTILDNHLVRRGISAARDRINKDSTISEAS